MWRRTKNSVFANLLLVGVAVISMGWTYGLGHQAWLLNREYQAARQKISQLEREKSGLQEQIVELGTAEAARREAKRRLNLKDPGEQVVVVVPDTILPASTTPESAGLWQSILSFFRKIW